VCACWVSRNLAVEHTTERKGIYPEFLARFEAGGESFLSRIVIADGSIILNRIQKGNPWNSTVFNLLGGKERISISGQGHNHWDFEKNDSYGCDAERGNSQLRGLHQDAERTRKRFERLRPHRNPKEILLKQGCTHVLRKNGAAITKFVWALLTRPPYCSDFPPSYFNLSGALKGAVIGTKFEAEECMMSAVRNWLRE